MPAYICTFTHTYIQILYIHTCTCMMNTYMHILAYIYRQVAQRKYSVTSGGDSSDDSSNSLGRLSSRIGQRVTFNVSQQMKTSPSEGNNLAHASGTRSPGKASPKHSPRLNRTTSEPITVPHSVRSADQHPVGSGESGSYPHQRSSLSPASPQVIFKVFAFHF